MKQIFQDLNSGKSIIEEVPIPNIKDNEILIKSIISLISTGTELSLINFSKSNYLSKAKQQPEKFNQLVQKVKSDGPKSALEAEYLVKNLGKASEQIVKYVTKLN